MAGIMIIAVTLSCNKIKQLTNINIDIPYSQQVTVPQISDTSIALPSGGYSIAFPSFAIPTNSQQYIDSYHTSSDKILRVNLNTLSMSIVGTGNFNFLDSLQLYVSGQGLQPQLIAYSYNIPKGLDSLSLDTVSNVNLKQYFLLDTMYVQIVGHFNAAPPGNTQLNINSIFHLLANPLD